MKVYLSGGMHSGWQDIVKARIPFECIDTRDHGLSDWKEYVPADIIAIRHCDAVFAYMENSNPGGQGLCAEVGYAAGLGKTVVVVDETPHRYMALTRGMADIWFDNLEAGIEYMIALGRLLEGKTL